jgi:cytosine/adenosine deaminase-related metal-dependent hydrolase
MKAQKIRAEKTFVQGELLPDILVTFDAESQTILDVSDIHDETPITTGWLIPGFINMHCHLELSYLKAKIPPRTGMAGFIRNLIQIRSQTQNIHDDVLLQAARHMYNNGIRAVADISNDHSTCLLKSNIASDIPEFVTFCETFGLNSEQVPSKIQAARTLLQSFPPGKASISWHAPYSMSPELISAITHVSSHHSLPVSLHFMESKEEIQLFSSGDGPLADFLKETGAEPLPPQFGNAHVADFILPLLPKEARIIFVHVTELDSITFDRIRQEFPNRAWCLCPGANLFIHGTLPPADMLMQDAQNVMIGTDSLAGNTDLCILAELKILSQEFPDIPTHMLLQWACTNPANFLHMPHLGSISAGNTPGLLLLTQTHLDRISPTTQIKTIL